jgi:hypothetical protein
MGDQKRNSEAIELPNTNSQAPCSISVESVDKNSRPAPYNPGSTPNGPQCGVAGEPTKSN